MTILLLRYFNYIRRNIGEQCATAVIMLLNEVVKIYVRQCSRSVSWRCTWDSVDTVRVLLCVMALYVSMSY